MTKPTLEIIIICKNDASHINRSIGGVIKNIGDKKNVRLLFVDDNSTDGSGDIVKTMILPEIGEVISTEKEHNLGGARNFAISYLNSLPDDKNPEYVWFHDSDDYLPDGSIDRVMDVLSKNKGVDCVSIPMAVLKKNRNPNGNIADMLLKQGVKCDRLEEAPNGPVSTCAQVIKMSKYVPQAENQMCEHVAWHFKQFDQFDTWAKVEGEEPCYVWDRTNDKAISETVDFCGSFSHTLECLAFTNILSRKGLKDKWVSDSFRNLANMYDVRNELKKPWVKQAWARRFKMEYNNMMTGYYVH